MIAITNARISCHSNARVTRPQPVSLESRVVGNYELGALIGRGGTSEVYAARHRFLGDPVAVKLLRSHLVDDAAASAAFVAEAVKTRAVVHDNVVRVFDVGIDDVTRCCFLVMEHVAGESLSTRLHRIGSLDEPAARRLVAAICRGMQAVHDRGIVHRDLKPANVMLTGDSPKIVDFGIAKELGSELAVTTGRRVGTPAYMAPEQLAGGLIAPCVDVWAVGVMLFELVTGTLPFERFSGGRCPQLVETAPRARSRTPISPQLDDLIARCLSRDPARRPTTMAEVAHTLENPDGDERITEDVGSLLPVLVAAEHVSPPRRRGLFIATGIAGVAALGLAIAFAWPTSSSSAGTTSVTAIPPAPPPIPRPTPPEPETPPTTPVSRAFELELRSTPAGAEIVIDGKKRGVTPARLPLQAPTSILVRRAGYRSSKVRAEKSGTIDVQLVRKRPTPRVRKQREPRETLD
jgi:serine/threonine protein kinase